MISFPVLSVTTATLLLSFFLIFMYVPFQMIYFKIGLISSYILFQQIHAKIKNDLIIYVITYTIQVMLGFTIAIQFKCLIKIEYRPLLKTVTISILLYYIHSLYHCQYHKFLSFRSFIHRPLIFLQSCFFYQMKH